jgi:hypothetical protein
MTAGYAGDAFTAIDDLTKAEWRLARACEEACYAATGAMVAAEGEYAEVMVALPAGDPEPGAWVCARCERGQCGRCADPDCTCCNGNPDG